MKLLFKATAVVALFVLSPGLAAQWPPHPSTSVPKTPDGKPDLNAPAPRTADGKPDFSAVWRGFPGKKEEAEVRLRRSHQLALRLWQRSGTLARASKTVCRFDRGRPSC